MTTLKERYLAKRKANVVIQSPVEYVEPKQSVWDTITDGIRYEGDVADDIYYDAIEGIGVISELLEDIGINPDRSYSVIEITAIRDAIAQIVGGKR